MTEEELILNIKNMMELPAETEYIEFKEAKEDFDFEKLGKYFSAISNETNLKKQKYGWIIFGISDVPPRKITGTNYKKGTKLQKLKEDIAQNTTGKITFDEIFEIDIEGRRVVVFRILPAPENIPIQWKGHYYGRDNEALVPLNIQEIEEIRNQGKRIDWSAEIIENATIEDLDATAIIKAREKYLIKNQKLENEIKEWDNITFLNKAKITINGKITNTAILLLGKNESEHYLSPANAKISWILKDENNIEIDYEHFGPPFLLNVEELFSKIRNLKYRYMPNGTIFPTEINQYDSYVIREVLNNCIAHQDYTKGGRISVVERKDELLFTNLGEFIPGTVENVLERDSPPEYYRNSFLANAMVNLDMIDTIGSGIKKMIVEQRKRYFPLPDFVLDTKEKVSVKIIGKVIDENYTNLLITNTSLDIKTVFLLDKIQKKAIIGKEDAQKLKNEGLIEGRYPNLFVSARVAQITGDKSTYIKNRGFDNEHYKKMIISFIEKYKVATRQDINELLYDKLPDILSDEQKETKIRNLIQELKKEEKMENTGTNKNSKWIIKKSNKK